VRRRAPMFEPILGLVVALLLGGYLVVTLVRPERF
jgi:K+-transporting ATPase KdpF subunit